MTIETCKRMMEICLKHNDKEGAAMYAARIERKMKKFPHKYPQEKPIVQKKQEVKEDGKER